MCYLGKARTDSLGAGRAPNAGLGSKEARLQVYLGPPGPQNL